MFFCNSYKLCLYIYIESVQYKYKWVFLTSVLLLLFITNTEYSK